MPAPPRLIVEVRWGPMNGRKVAIDAGKALRVGRTDRADLVIPHDENLSALHFQLEWDGQRCRLRDLGSRVGTLLDGEPIKEGEVEHAGWIHAGETDLSVYIEDQIPPAEAETDDPEDDQRLPEDERQARIEDRAREQRRLEAAEKAIATLRAEAEKEPLYAILDTARDDRILELLRQSVEPHQSLYEGIQGEPLATVAPYLAGPFRRDSRLLTRLVLEGWGKRWGVFVTSREPFKEVRRHFRRFLMVEMEGTGEQVYFRFYDPWVLNVFLPTCSKRQAGEFMSVPGAMFAEDDAGAVFGFRRP